MRRKLILRMRDGREIEQWFEGDYDPTASQMVIPLPSGMVMFTSTDEVNAEGCDVWQEDET